MNKVDIGISGWTYDGWKGVFYPPKLPHARELFYASRQFSTIEINGTFYALQKPSSYQHWYEETPPNFIFSVKANRYITHIKRLHDMEIPIANFFASGLLALKEKLGPILWQFPPSMGFDPIRFEDFLKLLPRDFTQAKKLARRNDRGAGRTFPEVRENFPVRHAVEVRHMSFLNPEFPQLLKKYGVAIVFADTAGRWPYLEDITSDFIYLRLHGDEELYTSGYGDETLRFWARRIETWASGSEANDRMTITDEKAKRKERHVFAYFDNDVKARAPGDAKKLKLFLGQGEKNEDHNLSGSGISDDDDGLRKAG